MTDKKAQKIVVSLSLESSDKNLILNGIRIASVFKKELCLLYNYPGSEQKVLDNIKNRLTSYLQIVNSEINKLNVSFLTISKKLWELPEILSDNYEAIMIIAPSQQYKKYSNAIAQSPVPFLFVNTNNDKISEYKNVILPVDLRSEISDTTLWSSYFGRYNKSRIVVIVANSKNKENRQQILKNIVFAKKLFYKFNIVHKILKGKKSSLNIVFEALDFAINSKADLIIILSSSTLTPLDYVVGLPERKIVKLAQNLPVLIINSRKDNYILCD